MVFSASSLIKRNVKDDFKEKQVDSIQDTQTVLLNELRKLTLQTPDYILDGHLCLLDNKNKIHRIDMKFIKQMSISSIILLVDSPAEIKKNLVAQLTASVRWTQSVKNMIADGATDFTECGPGAVLQGLIKKIDGTVSAHGIA